jgi:outer membrane protein assembly factor BamB
MLATLAGKRVILSNNARSLSAYDPADGTEVLDHVWGGEKWPKASQPVVISADRVFISAGYGMGCQLLQLKATADGKLSALEVWSGMKMKTQFNSPALLGSHLYGLDDGRLACLDVATGERLWKEGRYASGQSLLVGEFVIVQNERGPVHLCSASPEGYAELGSIEALSSKTWNHPVLSGRFLLVRNDREAVCYELPVMP